MTRITKAGVIVLKDNMGYMETVIVKPRNKESYSFPKGGRKYETNETVNNCAIRELGEECKLKSDNLTFANGYLLESNPERPNEHVLYLIAKLKSDASAVLTPGNEIERADWVRCDAIFQNCYPEATFWPDRIANLRQAINMVKNCKDDEFVEFSVLEEFFPSNVIYDI